jgi:ParB-like chromosome segregation protein Spo0J
MHRTENSSSSLGERLISVPLEKLRAHPANANVMPEERLEKLTENIRRERDYPPLIVRPHSEEADAYQILDGHQRLEALRRLGRAEAHCYCWPCDDRTALILLSTLNRLEGQDDPRLRAELIRELSQLASLEELALLLPEDVRGLSDSLAMLDLDLESLLADFRQETGEGAGLRSITFAVTEEDERLIEAAVASAIAEFEGQNRRGRALAAIARRYLEGRPA